MRRLISILAVMGAALVAALGVCLPRLTAAYQERELTDSLQWEEASAVSLTLAQAQAYADMPELDELESLMLYLRHRTAVQIDAAEYRMAEDAAAITEALYYFLDPDEASHPTEAEPWLVSDGEGVSAVYWRCGWGGAMDVSALSDDGADADGDMCVWIDDRSGQIVSFCLPLPEDVSGAIDFLPDEDAQQVFCELCIAMCDWLPSGYEYSYAFEDLGRKWVFLIDRLAGETEDEPLVNSASVGVLRAEGGMLYFNVAEG